jgi:hypothetical protein
MHSFSTLKVILIYIPPVIIDDGSSDIIVIPPITDGDSTDIGEDTDIPVVDPLVNDDTTPVIISPNFFFCRFHH